MDRISGRHTREQHRYAFHEAGHAVVAVQSRVRIRAVVLRRESRPGGRTSGGCVELVRPIAHSQELAPARRRAYLRIALAGMAAEFRWRRLSSRWPRAAQWLGSGSGDSDHCYSLARSLAPTPRAVEDVLRAGWTETWDGRSHARQRIAGDRGAPGR
jgi:hypothetical protein